MRRQTLFWVGILYFASAVWSGLATGPYTLMLARFIGGVGVGISTVAAPLYISEISPARSRGRLAGMFQFNIVFGILVAFLIAFFNQLSGINAILYFAPRIFEMTGLAKSAALLTLFFPKMAEALHPGTIFAIFCGMMVLQLVWVKTMVPETKGVPLEQMQKRLGVA